MSKENALERRMKENYENRAKTYLTRRCPVIIRLDGKAFHSFARNLKKPYDQIFHYAMKQTMKYLCQNIQGCKFGYTQSDEITLLLTDYDTLTTDAWFSYGVQKMCSISASMATMAFNRFFSEKVMEFEENYFEAWNVSEDEKKYYKTLKDKVYTAMFDSRCFNIPEEEVINCFIWRQQDATRNAIQMLGQCHFSKKELHKKSQNDIQDMLMTQKGINFNDMPVAFKRGVTCYKNEERKWTLDYEPPIFSKQREYIEKTFIISKISESVEGE